MLTISSNTLAQPFIGFSFGQATVDDACDGLPAGVSCDDSDRALKFFGGYKINKNAAFEASYIDMGEAVATDGIDTLTAEATAINLAVPGIIPASNTVDFFGKLGFAFWDAKVRASGTITGSLDDDGTDIMFGAGVNSGLTDQFALRAEFERFNNVGSETTTGESSVTILSVGGVIYF